jgi:hypothetical protein
LEVLHSGFLDYSEKYEKIYKQLMRMNVLESNNTLQTWIRKNKNYRKFIKNRYSNELNTSNITRKIPENFMEFFNINQDLSIGRLH